MDVRVKAAAITIATGAIGDAAVQGMAIGLGIQSGFSTTEMLEVGISAGALGRMALSEMLKALAAKALYVGTVQVGTQLAEMAAGLRSKFDAQAVALQVTSFVAGAKIGEGLNSTISDPHVANAATNVVTTVTNSVLGHAVTHAPLDVQKWQPRQSGAPLMQR